MINITVKKASPAELRPKPAPGRALGFGKILTDHLFVMDYEEGKGWFNPRIEPYRPFLMDPATLVLHYGQEVFEGMKAYRWQNGEISLFRPAYGHPDTLSESGTNKNTYTLAHSRQLAGSYRL